MGGKVKGKKSPNNCSPAGSSNKKKKNSGKKKKTTVKNTLANPFALDWPSLNYKDYTDIKSLLQNSLSAISKDYVSYQNEKNVKRREFYAAKMSRKNSDEISKQKSSDIKKFSSSKAINEKIIPNGLAIGLESLVFGYNAVMRGLEKGSVVSLLVYSKAKPEFIVKMFIPICSVKLIPVIPFDILADIVKDAGIGIRSCLALGLKKSVTMEGNLFHKLYLKTCEALGFEALPSDLPVDNNQLAKKASQISLKQAEGEAKPVRLSAEQIKSFHLYRNNAEERIFKPNELDGNNASTGTVVPTFDSEFIRFGDISEFKENKKNYTKKNTKKWQKSKPKPPNLDASKLPSTSMFIIDATGDSHDTNTIKDDLSVASDIILPFANVNNSFDGVTKEPAGSSTYGKAGKNLENIPGVKSEPHSSASLDCTNDESTENLDSRYPFSGNKRQKNESVLDSSDSPKVADSACSRHLMMNKKKRKFEEFCYVPTKVKRIKSNAKRKGDKK